MPFEMPHTHAVAPFRIVAVSCVYGPRDEITGTRSRTHLPGIGTVGFALMKCYLLNERDADVDFQYEVRDAQDSRIYQASTHDLRGRPYPKLPSVVTDDNEICF